MTARILRFYARDDAYDDYESDASDDEAGSIDEFFAGERIAPPSGNGRAGTIAPALLVIAIGGAIAWGVGQNPWALGNAVLLARTAIGATTAPDAPLAAQPAPAPVIETAAQDAAQAVKAPLPEVAIVQAPGANAGEAMPETEQAAAAVSDDDAAAATTDASAERLPTPPVDPKDPYQKRAAAVGLHPDLSRVLLTKMSATDFQNAGQAIKKALAQSGVAEPVVWPQKNDAKLARFEVRFVAGAPPDCRRYVVVVTKERWSTTARPMESCGPGNGVRRG